MGLSVALIASLIIVGAPGFARPARAGLPGAQATQAAELVRLVNGERSYHALPALALDPSLALKAESGDVACPDDPGLVAAGRAEDLALNGFVGNPHALRLCPSYTIADALIGWGYSGLVGEIYAWNYASDSANPDPSTIYHERLPYTYGCGDGVWLDCPGLTTPTFYTTNVAMSGWMASAGHRANILSDYTRVGCGGWASRDSTRHFVCLFAADGPNPTVDPPTTEPFASASPDPSASQDPAPTPSPTSAPPAGSPLPTTPAPVADTTPPKVSARSPGAGVIRVWTGASIRIVFSEGVKGVSRTTARLTNLRTGSRVTVSVAYIATTRTLVIDPRYRMMARTSYRVGLTSGISDLAGNRFAAVSWRFRTR